MSDVQVIDAFKARLATTSSPFRDTLNQRPSTIPDTFTSLERDQSTVKRITIGTPAMFREDGVLCVIVHTRAGLGDASAQTAAEEVRDAFHNYFVGQLQILEVHSPRPETDDAEGNFFRVRVPVQYQFDFFKP